MKAYPWCLPSRYFCSAISGVWAQVWPVAACSRMAVPVCGASGPAKVPQGTAGCQVWGCWVPLKHGAHRRGEEGGGISSRCLAAQPRLGTPLGRVFASRVGLALTSLLLSGVARSSRGVRQGLAWYHGGAAQPPAPPGGPEQRALQAAGPGLPARHSGKRGSLRPFFAFLPCLLQSVGNS